VVPLSGLPQNLWPFACFFHRRTRKFDQSLHWKINMSRVFNLLSTTARLSVTQVKPRAQIRQRPFARYISARPPANDVTCIMCLNNSRRFCARIRFALGSTALFIRTSLEKTGLWRPLLNLLSSSVGGTAARLIGVSPLSNSSLQQFDLCIR